MEPNLHATPTVALNKTIQFYLHPVWVFNSKTLTIEDGNKAAMEFCQYEKHELIGLRITELWHGDDLDKILDDIHVNKYERSFFGNIKHKKKDGEIVSMRLHATHLSNTDSTWIVHLQPKEPLLNKNK